MILVRSESDQLRAFYRYCPHDELTDLSNGFILADKLVCPKHGCTFSIETGVVEKGPA